MALVVAILMGILLFTSPGSAVAGPDSPKPARNLPVKLSEPVTYTIFWNAVKEPPGGVTVTLREPVGWEKDMDAMGCPSYKPPKGGFLDGLSVVLNACPPESRTSEACLAYWEKQEIAEDKVISKTPLEGGGVKIALKRRTTGGENTVSVSWLRPMSQVRGVLKTTIRLTEGVNDGFLPGLTQIAEGMAAKKP